MKFVKAVASVKDNFEIGDCDDCPFSYNYETQDEDDGYECITLCSLGNAYWECPIEFVDIEEEKKMNIEEAEEIMTSAFKTKMNSLPNHYDEECDDYVYDDVSEVNKILEVNKFIKNILERYPND